MAWGAHGEMIDHCTRNRTGLPASQHVLKELQEKQIQKRIYSHRILSPLQDADFDQICETRLPNKLTHNPIHDQKKSRVIRAQMDLFADGSQPKKPKKYPLRVRVLAAQTRSRYGCILCILYINHSAEPLLPYLRIPATFNHEPDWRKATSQQPQRREATILPLLSGFFRTERVRLQPRKAATRV